MLVLTLSIASNPDWFWTFLLKSSKNLSPSKSAYNTNKPIICHLYKLTEHFYLKTRCVKATRMAPSQKVGKSAISRTHVDTNIMIVSHIKNQLKMRSGIENKSV